MTAYIVLFIVGAGVTFIVSRCRRRVLLWWANECTTLADGCVSELNWENWNHKSITEQQPSTGQETALMLSVAKINRLCSKTERYRRWATTCLAWAKS